MMKRPTNSSRLLWILSLGIILLVFVLGFGSFTLFILNHQGVGPIPAFTTEDLMVYITSTSSPAENGIMILVNPGYTAGSDTFTCDQVTLQPNFIGHGPVEWIGQDALPASPPDGHYQCRYQHGSQQATFSIPVAQTPTILTPKPGQTIHHTSMAVRFTPLAQVAELRINSPSSPQPFTPNIASSVNTTQILVTPAELTEAPTGSALLIVTEITQGTVSQTSFRSIHYRETLVSSIPITVAP